MQVTAELQGSVESQKKASLEVETLKSEAIMMKDKLNEAQATIAKQQRGEWCAGVPNDNYIWTITVIETLNKQLTENELQRIIERSKTDGQFGHPNSNNPPSSSSLISLCEQRLRVVRLRTARSGLSVKQ